MERVQVRRLPRRRPPQDVAPLVPADADLDADLDDTDALLARIAALLSTAPTAA